MSRLRGDSSKKEPRRGVSSVGREREGERGARHPRGQKVPRGILIVGATSVRAARARRRDGSRAPPLLLPFRRRTPTKSENICFSFIFIYVPGTPDSTRLFLLSLSRPLTHFFHSSLSSLCSNSQYQQATINIDPTFFPTENSVQ